MNVKFQFIDLKAQYDAYKSEIDEAIQNVLNKTAFIMGTELKECEANLAKYTGAKHAITCSSGTSALELALRSIGITCGDEVIAPAFTFFATTEMISLLGATPVFVDIDEKTYNLSPALVEKAITPKTKAIVAVSLYGQCPDIDALNEIAKKHNITLIEDAAQSFGAEYKGKKSCNLSKLSCTSFFPAKPLGCYGDGGAVFTDSDEPAHFMRLFLNHGQNERYKHAIIGNNYRFDNLQAAVLNVKLKHFEDEIAERQKIAKRYDEALKDVTTIPFIETHNKSAYAQYSIRVKNREAVIKKLTDAGVPTAIHYPIPLYKQEVYKSLNVNPALFPITELVSGEIMSLPFSPFLKESDQDMVISELRNTLS